ncbi:alpha-(1,3)-fucosyltransferase C-like [Artemia franciscana]|uniref:Fucosyltransferase n=1 Tax=Artemia franciscana TaxID=6661 RepID=A0AA88H7W3_ARTSF|nr:hypothetical protein QYM36_014828 [Artemia franciscana]KAK2706931.1 hypothetical protein QYM36_014828 [Artemia franciscana]
MNNLKRILKTFFSGYIIGFIVCIVIFSYSFENLEKEELLKEYNDKLGEINLKKILLFNPFFSDRYYEFGHGSMPFKKHNCKISNCFLTDDHHLFKWEEYDAVIFHWPKLRGDPSVWSNKITKERQEHQRYVFFSLESPPNYRNDYSHFKNFFNWTMSYREDSDVYTRHGAVQPVNSSSKTSPINFVKKTKLISWFVSRCRSVSKREKYVKKLQKYISVDIYGYCGPFKCGRFGLRLKHMNCDEILRGYKFYLSLENSICKDYVTEKFYTALQHDTVPIVIGDSEFYKRNAPAGSYIDAQDYDPESLANYIYYLNSNETAYQEFFSWRKTHVSYMYSSLPPLLLCNLCERLNIDNRTKIISDIGSYWADGKCKSPTYFSQLSFLDYL